MPLFNTVCGGEKTGDDKWIGEYSKKVTVQYNYSSIFERSNSDYTILNHIIDSKKISGNESDVVAFVARRTKPYPSGYTYRCLIVEEKFKNVTSYTFPEHTNGYEWYLDTIFCTPYDSTGVPTDSASYLICDNHNSSRSKFGFGDSYRYYGMYSVDIYYK